MDQPMMSFKLQPKSLRETCPYLTYLCNQSPIFHCKEGDVKEIKKCKEKEGGVSW